MTVQPLAYEQALELGMTEEDRHGFVRNLRPAEKEFLAKLLEFIREQVDKEREKFARDRMLDHLLVVAVGGMVNRRWPPRVRKSDARDIDLKIVLWDWNGREGYRYVEHLPEMLRQFLVGVGAEEHVLDVLDGWQMKGYGDIRWRLLCRPNKKSRWFDIFVGDQDSRAQEYRDGKPSWPPGVDKVQVLLDTKALEG